MKEGGRRERMKKGERVDSSLRRASLVVRQAHHERMKEGARRERMKKGAQHERMTDAPVRGAEVCLPFVLSLSKDPDVIRRDSIRLRPGPRAHR